MLSLAKQPDFSSSFHFPFPINSFSAHFVGDHGKSILSLKKQVCSNKDAFNRGKEERITDRESVWQVVCTLQVVRRLFAGCCRNKTWSCSRGKTSNTFLDFHVNIQSFWLEFRSWKNWFGPKEGKTLIERCMDASRNFCFSRSRWLRDSITKKITCWQFSFPFPSLPKCILLFTHPQSWLTRLPCNLKHPKP